MSIFLFCGFGSCSSTLTEVCASKIPAFDRDLSHAVAALNAWGPFPEDRRIASGGGPDFISSTDRRSWQEWAEAHLKEVQHYIDTIEANAVSAQFPNSEKTRRAMANAANELVAFHGYAGQGRFGKMIASLVKTRSHVNQTQKAVCGTLPSQ